MISFVEYLIYLALGKLVIYIVQTASILEPFWFVLRILEKRCGGRFVLPPDHDLVGDFRGCGFCIGCWIFTIFAFYGKINMIDFLDGSVGYCLTGFFSSFVIHLVSGGWKYYYGE